MTLTEQKRQRRLKRLAGTRVGYVASQTNPKRRKDKVTPVGVFPGTLRPFRKSPTKNYRPGDPNKDKSVPIGVKILGLKQKFFGPAKFEDYTSKSIRNECNNEGCKRKRRHGSAYCQKCSDKHNS